MSWVDELARPDILALQAYVPAAWEPAMQRLHANELPWRALADHSGAGLNRYPQPQPQELIQRLARLYQVNVDSILTGRGSDEMIDLLTRAFCRAGRDSVIICPPTFAMYSAAARIQGATVIPVPLRADRGFELDEQAVLDRCTGNVKLIFLCSPNNPTGNLLDGHAVVSLAHALEGKSLVVVDEAYIEFSGVQSLASQFHPAEGAGGAARGAPPIAILRTLSKAYGLAGARVGSVIADPDVIHLLRKILPPYAIPQLTLESVIRLLGPAQLDAAAVHVDTMRDERRRLAAELPKIPDVRRVWPSDANFILARFADAARALAMAREAQLLIRDVRGYPGLSDCLRITVGTPMQNERLLQALR